MMGSLGRVTKHNSGLPYRVEFPDVEHRAASLYFRDLAASDCSATTLRSYGYDLLRWFRFLHERLVPWDKAERLDVRELVEYMRSAPTATSLRRKDEIHFANNVTKKAAPRTTFAARTINHQLSVLWSFYDFACETDLGPIVNPVPAQRGSHGRVHAHHSPVGPFQPTRRGTYRQRVPKPYYKGIPDEKVEAIFSALRSNRDRALMSFWLTSGARASELLTMRHGDYDFGEHTISVVTKGSREQAVIPASVDAFVWLARYMSEGQPAQPGDAVWWTLQGQSKRPLSYDGARAMFNRAQKVLGSNWTLHDLRHTAAERFLADPSFTLVDVQTILRHANISTTTIYTQPRLEDVLAKVTEHYARPKAPAPTIEPDYDEAAVRELLGLDG